jgi:hypothetical protein
MTTSTAASLVNVLGFITGIVLYVMLLWMVLNSRSASNRLLLLTGVLGIGWNVGALSSIGLFGLGLAKPAPILLAAAFGALCFMPAVVVHSALRTGATSGSRWNAVFVSTAYALSGIATAMHLYEAAAAGTTPSQFALRGVTVGFAALLAILLVSTRGRQNRGRVLWVVAMSVFAVSALHLSNHRGGEDPWWLELIGHHASLPLALLILYQDFRFALGDLFLKRALAFIFLISLTFGMFVFGVTPVLAKEPLGDASAALLLAMWISTVLVYPFLCRSAGWFVDKVVLKRVDYAELISRLSQTVDCCQTPKSILDEASRILAPALNAQSIEWSVSEKGGPQIWLHQDRRSATLNLPTAEKPQYVLSIKDFSAGRRLLSDDIGMLERAVLVLSHRIDIVRSMQERYQRDLREQEIRKLAAEAELRALRAQINPHFLFNALTTIGYLTQTAPERALAMLMRLSGLLRGVLRTGDEFVTIGEELDLIEAYLDIERARFEDRLRVFIDIPWELRRVRIPALLIQPLVENAVKHGISESITGGEVRIVVRLRQAVSELLSPGLVISVVDTGVGATQNSIERGKARGMGLLNVEQRLMRYSGGAGGFTINSTPGTGTTVELRILLDRDVSAIISTPEESAVAKPS